MTRPHTVYLPYLVVFRVLLKVLGSAALCLVMRATPSMEVYSYLGCDPGVWPTNPVRGFTRSFVNLEEPGMLRNTGLLGNSMACDSSKPPEAPCHNPRITFDDTLPQPPSTTTAPKEEKAQKTVSGVLQPVIAQGPGTKGTLGFAWGHPHDPWL